jgi:FkbM family methyltransferase
MICVIITPVGPGHLELFQGSCAPSVEQAKAFDMGPFTEVHHLMMDDTSGQFGRSTRRNEGVKIAKEHGADWIFFLDADDILTPNAFQSFGQVIAEESDLDVVWGLICTLDEDGQPQLRDGQPERLNRRADFLSTQPYLAIQIGGFMRASVVEKFPFDEAMDAGEDYRLYCQLWKEARCATRPVIFFLNRRGQHSTGPRSATGQDWVESTAKQWTEQLDEVPIWVEINDPSSDGAAAHMRVTNPRDIIQDCHIRGEYFEADSLAKLRDLIRSDAPSIVEVGANIGNHVVWYGRNLNVEKIYPVEPNPKAIALLDENIKVNDLGALIDRRGIGFGAGNQTGRFRVQTDDENNLGATRLVPDETGEIETCTLDELMGDARVDFIKIDAEGMELDVLEGAQNLIAREKPVIWVEVLRENMMKFVQKWCREAGYRVVDSRAYAGTVDYFAIPKG